ncbi:hypothetical protein GcM1_196019 [Golovinomyces cichoracearum]|uniref:Uncharacterized protein n=1 Tax=Golovinomyces cichoracearum TaxID=62708 RepID=A0A420IZZ2_9PEZI|nr:hypothetical protein GcM1_196019 [Golovinomyces cichoracearum]
MPTTIKTTIKWFEDSAIKYKNSRLQDEELWEIVYDDVNEAIATGVIDIESLKPTSNYKTAFNGSTRSSSSEWRPLASLQSLISSEVTSITDISLSLQYLYRKNGVIKSESGNNAFTTKMKNHIDNNNLENPTPILIPSSINQHISSTSTDDLPRILGKILRIYQGDDKKYGGLNDSLDYKMDMYEDICDVN